MRGLRASFFRRGKRTYPKSDRTEEARQTYSMWKLDEWGFEQKAADEKSRWKKLKGAEETKAAI